MKQLVVLSGKGGTGKTTVAASFIALGKIKAYADCDVDAPNLHLVCAKDIVPEMEAFYGYKKAFKEEAFCISCGKCEELCRFGAIRQGLLYPMECEGCGVCEAFCPSLNQKGEKAIRLLENISGQTMIYQMENELLSSAELSMGNGASGKLVTQVRKNLYKRLSENDFIILDGSPGIGCPVIASITGVNKVLMVAEPTISGLHDLDRVVKTAWKFGIECMVCINKYDISLENTRKIEEYCSVNDIRFVGKIPYDKIVMDALQLGIPVVLLENSEAKNAIEEIWEKVLAFCLE